MHRPDLCAGVSDIRLKRSAYRVRCNGNAAIVAAAGEFIRRSPIAPSVEVRYCAVRGTGRHRRRLRWHLSTPKSPARRGGGVCSAEPALIATRACLRKNRGASPFLVGGTAPLRFPRRLRASAGFGDGVDCWRQQSFSPHRNTWVVEAAWLAGESRLWGSRRARCQIASFVACQLHHAFM